MEDDLLLEPDLPPPVGMTPRRRATIAAVIGLVGLGAGALASRAAGRFLALPDDAERPTYADAAAAESPRDGAEPAPDAEAPRGATAMPKASYIDPIVSRNIFDSSAVGKPGAAAVAEGTCRADAAVKLVATVVAEPEIYSSALISTGAGKEGRALGYAVGDEVSGAGRIARIEFQKVCLDDGSCLCIGEQGADAPAAGKAEGASGAGGVEKVGDNKFQVDKSVIDEALSNVDSLSGMVRPVPHKDASGAIDGFRLSAIRKGSLLEKLGIKNGDIVHGVNGQPLTSVEGALSLTQTLRSERSFNFDITRRGNRQALEYEVR